MFLVSAAWEGGWPKSREAAKRGASAKSEGLSSDSAVTQQFVHVNHAVTCDHVMPTAVTAAKFDNGGATD